MSSLDADEIHRHCEALLERVLDHRALIIAANRAPVTFETKANGE
jgi:hypothetical protein